MLITFATEHAEILFIRPNKQNIGSPLLGNSQRSGTSQSNSSTGTDSVNKISSVTTFHNYLRMELPDL